MHVVDARLSSYAAASVVATSTSAARFLHPYCCSALGKMNELWGLEVRNGPQNSWNFSMWGGHSPPLQNAVCFLFGYLIYRYLTYCAQKPVLPWPACRGIDCVSILRYCCRLTHNSTWFVLRHHFITHARLGDRSRWRSFQLGEKHMRQRVALLVCKFHSCASRWLLFSR